MPPNLMTARNLTKVYDTGEVKVHALRGVDLDIAQGELIVLLGPSGSGKSTLLNQLVGEKVAITSPVPPDHPQPAAGDSHHPRRPAGAAGHPWHPQTSPLIGRAAGQKCPRCHR